MQMEDKLQRNRKRFFFRVLVLFLSLCPAGLYAEEHVSQVTFGVLGGTEGLPSNEIRRIYQDKEGYIWIATNGGLVRYDGYEFYTYKSNLYHRDLLSSNTVTCVVEDNAHRLWIGTGNGLHILDKLTGKITKIAPEKLNNNFIQALLTDRKGDVWIGTNHGLHRYIAGQDTIMLYSPSGSEGSVPALLDNGDIKTLYEDGKGQIWIGTWSSGFFRYNPLEDRFYTYPSINPRNSAHVIYGDSAGNIWIGTWEYGLFRLKNPYDPKLFSWVQYRHREGDKRSLADDIIYALSENLQTGDIWIGSRSGLSILKSKDGDVWFQNYLPGDKDGTISYNELNTICRDSENMMWLGMMGGGVNIADTWMHQFNLHRLEDVKSRYATNSVRSILVDDEGYIWIGIGSYGILCHDRKSGKHMFYTEIPDLKSLGSWTTTNTIVQRRKNRELWFGTYDAGLIIYDKYASPGKRVKVVKRETHPWLVDDRVYFLYEDSGNNMWIGTLNGVSVWAADGQTFSYRLGGPLNAVYAITEDQEGNIWLGTNQCGVYRVEGDFRKPEEMKFINYSSDNKNFADNVTSFCVDKKGHLWIGTEGEGLCMYEREKDVFRSVHAVLNLPGDAVYNIVEDSQENLWLGTNNGLLCVNRADSPDSSNYRLYTTVDGLQDNIFIRNAVFKCPDGELFFGGHKGYNCFYPERLRKNRHAPPVVITDIRVHNRSWQELEPREKEEISPVSPEFTRRIVLDHKQNNFNIDFAVLSYANPAQNKYAYRLEGYDNGWQYTDASRNFAYYNNLKSGTYRFYLKGANENGVWGVAGKQLEIVILPAPWATWWAYCLYALGIGILAFYIFYLMHKRIQTEAAAKLAEVKRQKSEEINHAKLQFFTNITHELMTPLTIILATLDEYKFNFPKNSDYYSVIYNNTHRLMRLLQQILEFRKAESGNLKLKVCKGDLMLFVRNSVNSFSPLVKKKGIAMELKVPEQKVEGYFDPDKLDKILYNLLSNAAKYNKENGKVEVCLEYDGEKEYARISVKDDGEGMSAEAMKHLFKRFYEGNYRRFNTVGTGIGLSLVKDLIDLHQGDIRVESRPGEGTTFIIGLPLSRASYEEGQIDEEIVIRDTAVTEYVEEKEGKKKEEMPLPADAETKYTLLVVEDNEELRQLLVNMLGRSYRVLQAADGAAGVKVAETEQVDLILSDIMMPEMDGIELCRYIKEKFELCHIPVVLLTAKQSEEDQIAGYDSGADGYIRKPFSLPLLSAKINSLLQNRERTARDFEKQMVLETKELNYTSMDEKFMQQAVDCVYRHLDDPDFGQQQFLEEMGTSKSTLYAKLKTLTGLNTSAFIRNIRLKAACRIIKEKKKVRISELAYAVGFNDAKYFSACFKKEFGMLPTEYMENLP